MESISPFSYTGLEKMDIPFTQLSVIIAWATGSLCAYLAYRRGRNLHIWFCIGFLFGILGLLAMFFTPTRKKLSRRTKLKSSQTPDRARPQGPKDKFWYYLEPDHKQAGPMSLEALTTLWQQGKISLTTYVWHEELPEWKPLQELLGAGQETPPQS
jgi:GYF domain 2